MKKIKFIRILSCILLIAIFAITGCSASKTNNKDADVNEYEEAVFDREAIEGKMAVYYLSSGLTLSNWNGQVAGGDAILMIFPDGTTALLDCGHQAEGAHVLNRMKQLGIEKLDYFIVSHPHTDHIGGFDIIARHIDIEHIYMPPTEVMERADVVGLDFINTIETLSIPYTHVAAGDTFKIAEDVTVNVYNPEKGFGENTKINLNESSLLLKFIYKDSSFLFTGDIANNDVSDKFNHATEDWLVKKYGDELKADVLKIAHHGNGDTMSSMEYRAAISPKITVTISTFPRDLGEHNKNITAGAVALNTALDGDILVCTDGDGTYTVGVCHERTAAEYETLDTDKGFMIID